MGINSEILDVVTKLDEELQGGFQMLPIVTDKDGYVKEIKEGRCIYFRKPTRKIAYKKISDASELIYKKLFLYSFLHNNYEMPTESKEKLKKLVQDSLETLFFYDKKDREQQVLRGYFYKYATLNLLPEKKGQINEEAEREKHFALFRGFTRYIVNVRLDI